MVFNLWLAAIVYHVYGTCKEFLTFRSQDEITFTDKKKKPLLLRFISAALSSRILNDITNIFACNLFI